MPDLPGLGEEQALYTELAQHKRTEQQLEQRVAQLETLYRLSESAAQAESAEAIYDAALEGLQHTLHAARAAVLLFDPDGVIRFKAWRGLSDAYRQAAQGHSPWTPDTL